MKGDGSGRHDDAEGLLRIIVRSRFKLSTRETQEVVRERRERERIRDTKCGAKILLGNVMATPRR